MSSISLAEPWGKVRTVIQAKGYKKAEVYFKTRRFE